MKRILFLVAFATFAVYSPSLLSQSKRETAFTVNLKNNVQANVELVFLTNDPEFYCTRLRTPVCEDSLCYLVDIDLFWDLLGYFQRYETPRDNPLTKFDHVVFTKADDEKLAQILANRESPLKHYPIENLVDASSKIASKVVVDATVGATSPAIKNEVVDGALFSTYTLWHIANGEIAAEIGKRFNALINERMITKMLESANRNYQYFAINHLPLPVSDRHTTGLIRLISEGADAVPYFAIEKLPDSAWRTPASQIMLAEKIRKVPFQMQNEILNKFKNILLSSEALDQLVGTGEILLEDQQKKVLAVARFNTGRLSQAAGEMVAKLTKKLNP